MPRFFKENFSNEPFISGDDAKHIAKSLRMKIGEPLCVCDTKGNDYSCVISGIFEQKVELEILSVTKSESEPSVKVTLFFCLTKSDKPDTVIKQSVELGVNEITPVLSSRCVSRPDEKSASKKLLRWQKISEEAAMQSGRGIIPRVNSIISFDDMTKAFNNFDKVFIFYEGGGNEISKILETDKNLAIIIGPEGGFSEEEVEKAKSCGAIVSTLGKRILRAETAPIAALSVIMLQSANMSWWWIYEEVF